MVCTIAGKFVHADQDSKHFMSDTSQPIESSVSSGDRLSFTLFLAAVFHGLVILGLGFSYLNQPYTPPTFEVTLATHKSNLTPEDAQFQAQFNQEASGTTEKAQELTTTDPAPFADTRINEVRPLPETRQRQSSEAAELAQVSTSGSSSFQVSRQENDELEVQQEVEGQDQDIPYVSSEIASLRAKLDRQRQAAAQRPRKRHFTSVSTIAAAEAEYLNEWRQKIERVGNENFPEQALREGIVGQLRLVTVVKADGSIVSVEISESSGHSILDNAALQIVRQAAPFAPFPPEVRKDWDQMEIIRTWRFDITGLSTSIH